MSTPHFKIGTRGSRLALWQAEHVKELLKGQGVKAEIITIDTQGDKDRASAFSQMSGSGFFTKTIEEALLDERVDIAVHSHKDLETTPTLGTHIAAIPPRANPSDLFLVHPDSYDIRNWFPVIEKGKVGTSSPRRKEQLSMFRPDIEIAELRGNVTTRLQKLRDKEYDAILLAKAGVDRLGLDVSDLPHAPLDPITFIPAPAQGALAIQVREADHETREVVSRLGDPFTAETTGIERTILNLFRGGCQLPLGAHCRKENGEYQIWCMVVPQGKTFPKRIQLSGKNADELARETVERITKQVDGSLLLTKDLSEDHWWRRSMELNGQETNCRSLIEIEPLQFVEPTTSPDLIFFNSRNAVDHFLNRTSSPLSNIKVGAMGAGTASAVRSYGIEPDIVGEGPPQEVGRTLCQTLSKGQKVLFPCSDLSKRSVQEYLEKEGFDVMDLPVYSTREKQDAVIPDTDTILFTSPSNVRAYFAQRNPTSGSTVISIGRTTFDALPDAWKRKNSYISERPDLLGLMDTYFRVIS